MLIILHNVTGCFATIESSISLRSSPPISITSNLTPTRTLRLFIMDNKPLSKTWLRQILGAACRADHVPFVTRCISMTQLADSQVTLQEVLQVGLQRATNHAAMEGLPTRSAFIPMFVSSPLTGLSPRKVRAHQCAKCSSASLLEATTSIAKAKAMAAGSSGMLTSATMTS